MHYCAKLTTTLKQGVEVTLHPRTVLVGRNEAGKTTVLEALELILTGQIQGLGKDALELALLSRAGSGSGGFGISADFRSKTKGNGEDHQIEAELVPPAKGRKRPELILRFDGEVRLATTPIGAILSHDVIEILKSEPKRQREAFLRLVSPKGVMEEARKCIPEAYAGIWESCITDARAVEGGELPEADLLTAAIEAARASLADAKKEAKKAPSESEAPSRPDMERADKLKVRIHKLESDSAAREKRSAARVRLQKLREERAGAARVITQKTGVDESAIRLGKRTIAAAEVASSGLDRWQEKGGEYCYCCGAESAWWKLDRAAGVRTEAEVRLQKAEEAAVIAISSLPKFRSLQQIDGDIAYSEGILDTSPELPPVDLKDPSVGDLRVELKLLEEAARCYEAWNKDREAARAAEAQVEQLETIIKAGEKAEKSLLVQALKSFEDRLSLKLFSGLKGHHSRLKIDLFGSGRRGGCRVGLVGEGEDGFVSWRTLAGSRRAQLFSALSVAWAHKYPPSILCRLVRVDEAALDDDHLAALCGSLGPTVDSPGGPDQIVVTAVHRPGVDLPGWEVVELS